MKTENLIAMVSWNSGEIKKSLKFEMQIPNLIGIFSLIFAGAKQSSIFNFGILHRISKRNQSEIIASQNFMKSHIFKREILHIKSEHIEEKMGHSWLLPDNLCPGNTTHNNKGRHSCSIKKN